MSVTKIMTAVGRVAKMIIWDKFLNWDVWWCDRSTNLKSKSRDTSKTPTAPTLVIFPSPRVRQNNSNKFIVHSKLFEIPWLVKTRCFHCSRHPSCSLAFKKHALNRPFPPAASSLPLSNGVPLLEKGGGVTRVSRLSCQHRFHVLSRVCEGLCWNAWSLWDTVWGHSRSDLWLISPWTPCLVYI